MQQTTPQGLVVLITGALHVLLPVHALLEPQRQTGAAPLVSHHSPPPQHALPQHGPVVQLHEGSIVHWWPPWPPVEPPEPVPAVPPWPPPPESPPRPPELLPPVPPPSPLPATEPQPLVSQIASPITATNVHRRMVPSWSATCGPGTRIAEVGGHCALGYARHDIGISSSGARHRKSDGRSRPLGEGALWFSSIFSQPC